MSALPPGFDCTVTGPSDSDADRTNIVPRGEMEAQLALPPVRLPELTQIGEHYRLTGKLGQGGMGAVYRATDARDGRTVAIKTLPREATPDEQAVRRFQKEARLLSEVRHPHVANLLETGVADGMGYLVMELVEGVDLKGLLRHSGPLPERMALQIVRDVASALAVAHERGIVHRDIKPGNILLSAPARDGEEPPEAVEAAVQAGCKPLVKLTDFGLARQIEQSASLDLTRTGAMLGTPYYISPEQCSNRDQIGGAADVYSLGATLFEMLTGRPPFHSDDPVKLIAMHCFETPPDPRKLNSLVSDGAAALVVKTLQKRPESRHANGSHLVAELDRLLQGDLPESPRHPPIPESNRRIFEAAWEWDLQAEPAVLWPLVSNTERVNLAIGLPAVQYESERDAQGTLRRFGSCKLGWSRLKWEEHPYEWVEGRRMGVLREFLNGPFLWFISVVELEPRPEGGTRLRHQVRIAPRGWIGRVLAHLEVNVKARRAFDRLYRRIDQVATGRLTGSPALDPFEPPAALRGAIDRRFEQQRTELHGAGVDGELASRLIQFLKESPARELARIRPLALARRLETPAERLTEACLHGCRAGLLELHWDVICPTCRVSANVVDTLAEIGRHARCEACDLDFDVDFANAVELIFRIHPELRTADLRTYCVGGPWHAPHVIAQIQLKPGETFELDLALDPGSYVLRGPQLPYTVRLVSSTSEGTTRLVLPLSAGFDSSRLPKLNAGRQLLTLENRFERPLVVRIERSVPRADVLTAAQAGRLPVFRQLFPAEVLTRDRLSDLSASTLLAVRVSNLPSLVESIGEAAAYHRLGDALRGFRDAAEQSGGRIVKEDDEQILAAFEASLEALRVATDFVLRDHAAADVRLQAALHRGAALTTSVDGRVNYFGRAVTTATSLLIQAPPGSVVLSPELARDREASDFLAGRGLRLVPGPMGDGALHVAAN